jgi:hypothetical protein
MARPGAFKPAACGPVRGVPPTLEWVPVERLQVDEAYQRATDGPHSRRIIVGMVKQWDWALCQPLVVSRRTDGSLFILDGQHRHSGAVERGDVPHLPCVILSDRDAAGEAETFVALNTRRQKLSQADVFNGMLAAGDADAKTIGTMIAETGWRVRKSSNTAIFHPGDLVCAPMLARLIKTHGECAVRNALTALREAYPTTAVNCSATLLRALATIYRDGRLAGLDCDTFIETLGSIEPNDWLDSLRDMQRGNPSLSRQEALVEAFISETRAFAMSEAA